MIIAIDGPAGTGKGTISKLIAENLGYIYIDTGAMYRAFALKMIKNNISLEDMIGIEKLLDNTKIEFKNIDGERKIFLDDADVSSDIRMPNVNSIVSPVSSIKIIRIKMVELQRKMAQSENIIMEGRDITTVVFPNADIKIYLTADLEERAKRRYKELISKGIETTFEEVYESIEKRDKNDMTKEMGALKIAEDAVVVDSTNMTIEEVYGKIKEIIERR